MQDREPGIEMGGAEMSTTEWLLTLIMIFLFTQGLFVATIVGILLDFKTGHWTIAATVVPKNKPEEKHEHL